MKNFKIFFASFLFLVPIVASSFVVGNSNLMLHDYPEFDERKPYPPYSKDESSYNHYRMEVKRYVEKAKDYAEGCENDARRAYEARDEAIRKANRAVEEFNDWLR